MDKPLNTALPAEHVDPAWLTLRRDFERARRDCSAAFARLIQAVEGDGDLRLAHEGWRTAAARRTAVDEGIARYVRSRLGAAGP